MNRAAAAVLLVATGLLGLFQILRDLHRLRENRKFAEEFMTNIKEYWESGGSDVQAYGWLIHRSNKMQNHMGTSGIIHGFKPPFANYMYNNYAIILNMLPELKKAISGIRNA